MVSINIFRFTLIIILANNACYAAMWNSNSFLNLPQMGRSKMKSMTHTSPYKKSRMVDDYLVSEGKDSELPPEFQLTESQEAEILSDLLKGDSRDPRQSDDVEDVAPGTDDEILGAKSSTNVISRQTTMAPPDSLGFGLLVLEPVSEDEGTDNDADYIVAIPNYSYSVCGKNTEQGIKACESSCTSKVYNCVGKKCFCSDATSDTENGGAQEEQLPAKSPFHICGQNTYEGSLACRKYCNLLKDVIVCAGKICYCNLLKSTEQLLEHKEESPNPKRTKRTDEIIFEELKPSPVFNQWDCYIGEDKASQVAHHESCIKECNAMKEYDPRGGIILTCNNKNAVCKCISFLPLTKKEIESALEPGHITKKADPRKCRGYSCLIQSNLLRAENDVKETLSETTLKNYIYCGPNSELGFTKCRDICTFEQAGVVRCGGFSCYCHYGSIPILKSGSEDTGESKDEMQFPYRSRFIHCGKDKAECQTVCQHIGEVTCGRLGCYCDSGL